ncbi:MAG: hypothetical protein HOD85_27340 [Deltaproteobacteria bacterium]|jgi:hypothetical protein|nr:hypothetical protein [Deltaproteobacteria bacterium]
MADSVPKVNAAGTQQSIKVFDFNNFISVVKSLDVKAVDIFDSVLFHDGDDVLIDIDLKNLFSPDLTGQFPIGEDDLKNLSNIILSDSGEILILKDKHGSITIKKDGTNHEYYLGDPGQVKSLPVDIRNGNAISDLIDASDDDISKFQKLFAAESKNRFVIQDKKRFCITNKKDFILDQSIQSQLNSKQKPISFELPQFITYRAEKAKFQIIEQLKTNTLWLKACYQQHSIMVDAYIKLNTKQYYQTGQSQPGLNQKSLTLLGHITPKNFDIFVKYLSFFSDAQEIIIHQGKTYVVFNNKLLAYCDSSAFFSKQVSLKIKKPGRLLKESPQLSDNTDCAVPYDLTDRKKILIAENTVNNKIVFIRVTPGSNPQPTLKDYLATGSDYSYEQFDTVKSPPKVFNSLNLNIGSGIKISPKYREKILFPEYHEVTDPIIAKIKKDIKPEDLSDDGFIKPSKKQFFDDIVSAVGKLKGNIYSSSEQFSAAYDDVTREMIDAVIRGDYKGQAIHARKRDIEVKNVDPQRRDVITQQDINIYRSKIAQKAKSTSKKPISSFELYIKNNNLSFCNAKGKIDITYLIGNYNVWDSMYNSNHFLSFDAHSYECQISRQNQKDWLVTKHRFMQKEIITFEDLGQKVNQQNLPLSIISPTINDPTKDIIESLNNIGNRIVFNYQEHLKHRFEVLKDFCHILKHKHYYFKNNEELVTFFEELREKMEIAQSTLFADRRVAEMLISLKREDILNEYKSGMSYKLMKITSANDDKTKEFLLTNVEKLKREDVDRLVAQSRSQHKEDQEIKSKIRGLKIKKENKRIVLSFEQKWDEKPEDVKKKVEKIAKLIAKIDNSNIED